MKSWKSAASCGFLALMFAMSAYAETVRVSIPFKFHAGEAVLPAGTYTAQLDSGRGRIYLQQQELAAQSYVPVLTADQAAVSEHGVFTFHRYGTVAYLKTVKSANGQVYQFFPSRAERESAKKAAPGGLEVAMIPTA